MTSPDFGPRGYLPERASRRARKIVLRERMGLGWPLAAIGAALVVVLTGTLFVTTRTGAPSPPYVAVAPLASIDPGRGSTRTAAGVDVLLLRAGGVLRAFVAPGLPAAFCAEAGRIEAAAAVWTLEGRLVGGSGASLRALPAVAHDGTVYVDPTRPAAAPAPRPRDERPACDLAGDPAGAR